MIYTRTGAGITVDGVSYFVGMYVLANSASEYAGLYGVVTEIRTDDDRETENDTPDIYCQFDAPVLPCEVRELEARFSSLYGQPKKLEEVSLDMVIMAPEMLEPSINPNAANPATYVWAVVEDWAIDDETGHDESLFVSREDAIAVLHSKLSADATEGCIPSLKDKADFQRITCENSYECWLDGDYIGNHYKISIEQKPLIHEFTPKEEPL